MGLQTLYEGWEHRAKPMGIPYLRGAVAELAPDAVAQWYVVLVEPGRERIAAAHLAGRRFGVYLPERDDVRVVRGKPLARTYPLFPGYLFVFCWDIDHSKRRIEACPGVTELLKIDGRYAVLSETDIHDIRREENRARPLKMMIETVSRKKSRWRRSRLSADTVTIREQAIGDNEIVSVRTWSALHDLDDAGRVGVLRKALSLA